MKGTAIGVDGCKSGWIAVATDQRGDVKIDLFPKLETLWERYGPHCSVLLIDMPIGLADEGPDGRECDRLARKMLSPRRHSSIFTPPCRPALYAPEEQASGINFQHTGKKLSRQTINIMSKMRAVDQWIRGLPLEEQRKIHESHPEVVFTAMNDGIPLTSNKKGKEGREVRIHLMQQYLPTANSTLAAAMARFPRKLVLPDDLVDALALAITARGIAQDAQQLRRLPPLPPRDTAGLPMEIVYCHITASLFG